MNWTQIFTACFLLLIANNAWGAVSNVNSGTQVNITITITVGPTIQNVLTADSDNDGYLDQLIINFDQLVNINDNLGGADGLSGIVVSNGYQIVPADYTINNTSTLTLNLIPNNVPDTGVTPIVDFIPGIGTDIISATTGLTQDNQSLISTDGANPVFMSAESVVGSSIVTMRFSEPTFGTATGVGPVEFADITFTDLSGNGGPNAISLIDDDASDLIFTVQLDAPLTAGDFGSDTLTTASNEFFDLTGLDAANTTLTLQLLDSTAPNIATIVTRDLNANGYIDSVLIAVDENISDSTINPNDFFISGAGTLTLGTLPGELANDNLILLEFTDGLLDSGQTPQVSYTAGSLVDLAGNGMPDQSATTPVDNAGPAILSANTVTDTTVRIVFSEPVDDSSLNSNDFFFNGFITSAGNGYGIAFNTGSFASDNEVIITLPGTVGPNETGIVSLDSPGVIRDIPGIWNDQNTGIPVTDGNPNTGPVPVNPNGPRIVSEAKLWALEDDRWSYNIKVDVRELVPEGHLGMLERFDLQFQLGAGSPAGMTITKTGALTARVTWPQALGNNEHVRITVQVDDLPSTTQELQDVLIYVVDQPSSGN